ncbi:MAG: hypothetical protein IJP14_03040, partial [Clostridia bacterium]|nr:hypothetical protein [Clostridia bacterium]
MFELYFTPLGGGAVTWDELNSPYCKYLRKLYDSEDYILFSWNAAEYNGKFALGQDMEKMIIGAFHQNRNPQNKIYANMESFDPTTFADLKIGTDIGYVSINKWERGQIHNKDLMFSYVENGQRYYVTLHNSTNMHSGSMCYQSNFALVIKETTCAEDSVFSTFAQNTTTQDFVEHTYGEEQTYTPANTSEDGYTYRECTVCAHQMKTGVVHQDGEWVVDREPTAEQNGIRHKNCPVCGERTHTQELPFATEQQVSAGNMTGKTFTGEEDSLISLSVNEVPRTWEAVIQLSPAHNTRGGVIVGNYGDAGEQINLEIQFCGLPRLFYINAQGERADILFNTDVRSNKPTHMAITVDQQTATLYVNGVAVETLPLPIAYPTSLTNLKIGGDNRTANQPIFGGRIYTVSLFNDVRTAAEIERDLILVTDDADSSLLCNIFLHEEDSYAPTSAQPTGKVFAETEPDRIPTVFTGAPMTWEATLQLSPSVNGYGGAIVSNIGIAGKDQIGWEIAENGNPKLVFIANDGTRSECVFETDIRSDVPLHVAITLSAQTATLYINAQAVETQTLPAPIPTATTGFCIGGDHQSQNPNAFQGILYAVNLFQDVRTQTEIASDLLLVAEDTAGLQYSAYYTVAKAVTVGQTFTADNAIPISLKQAPRTLEAVIHLPQHHVSRGGVIVGNYSGKGSGAQLKFEVMEYGHPRLFIRNQNKADIAYFSHSNVRSDSAVHVAITLTDYSASLYINGQHSETVTWTTIPAPEACDNFLVGGDHSAGNVQYFKGTIYSTALFSDVRTAEEIRSDTLAIPSDADALLYSASYPADTTTQTALIGQTFTGKTVNKLPLPLNGTPHTIEAIIKLPKTFTQRGGVLFGNYTGSQDDQMNLEIYTNGTPRLWYKVNGVTYSHIFKTSIGSDSVTQLALSYNDEEACLFVNGVLRETVSLACPLPDVRTGFCVGGDNRVGNTQFFKGTIYALNVFSNTRSEAQLCQDGICVLINDPHLLYTKKFTMTRSKLPVGVQDGKTFSAHAPLLTETVLTDSPKTIEAIVSLPTEIADRGGIIIGNYDGSSPNQLNLEIWKNGQLRLFFTNNGARISHLFNTDVRSDIPVHLAVTLDGCDVTLYVNGTVTETVTLPTAPPYVTDNFCIGSDNRAGNPHYFKGTIYGVGLYNVVKTAE